MERRWNPIGFVAIMVLLASVSVFAAGGDVAEEQESVPGAVPGKKFCVRFGGVDDSYLALSQQPSSYTPQSGQVDGESYDETCYDLWYDTSVENYYDEDEGAYTTSIETHCSGYDCIDAFSYLAKALTTARSGITLLNDIDFGGVNADSSCVVAFRPLPKSSYGLDGKNHTIKNLCFVLNTLSSAYTADYDEEVGSGDSYGVGFFSELEGGSIYDLKIENVYIKVKNGDPYYSVPTGVLVGKFGDSWPSITNVSLKNVRIVAAYAGALAGSVAGYAEIHNISGQDVEIFAAEGTVATSMDESNYDAYSENLTVRLGGLFGSGSSGGMIANVGFSNLKVHSDVESIILYPENPDPVCDYDEDPDCEEPPVTGTSQDIYGYIGGLLGTLSSGERDVIVANTYTSGDISYEDGDYTVGFLAGEMDFSGGSTYYAGYNYHYGATDYQAENVAGWLYLDGSDLSSTWISGYGSLGGNHPLGGGYNYRNSISGKIEPTNCNLDNPTYMGPSYGYHCLVLDGSNYGGYVRPDSMKKEAFAAWFNGVTTDSDIPYLSAGYDQWSRKNDVNSGFPVFANESLKPIYSIEFMATDEVYSNLSSAEQQKWEDAGATVNSDGATLSVYTDYAGKISDRDWLAAAVEQASENYYWSYNDHDLWGNAVKAYPLKSSSVFNSGMTLSLAEKLNLPVAYGFVNIQKEQGQSEISEISTEQVTNIQDMDASDYYFMGDPIEKVVADDIWSLVPYVAVSSQGSVSYYAPQVYVRQCSGGSCNSALEYLGSGKRLFSNAFAGRRYQLTSEDSLYVIYNRFYTTSSSGGNLFVADLYGESFGSDANVQVGGVNGGSVSPFYTSYLDVTDISSEDITSLIEAAMEGRISMPYSPYVTAEYSSDIWGSVDDMVGFVVVGSDEGSASSAANLIETALNALIESELDLPALSSDTLTALESPEVIRDILEENAHTDVSYARFVRMGADGTLDLTNLFEAREFVRSYDASFPVFVGFMPRLHNVEYHVTFDVEAKFYGQDEYYNSLFVADPWLENEGIQDVTYTRDNKDDDFFSPNDWRLVKTDGCYRGGWSFLPFVDRGDEVFDIYGIYVLENQEEFSLDEFPIETNDDGSKSLTLYTYWETDPESCLESQPRRVQWDDESGSQVWDNAIIEDKSKLGNIVLQQVWAGDTLRHKSVSLDGEVMGIVVPRAEELSYTFEVLGEGMPGYELNGDITFSYLDRRQETNGDGSVVTKKLKDGEALTITPGMYENMEFSAKFVLKTYNIVFVPELENVLYGENSPREGTYKLKDEEDAIDLPVWVYTADRCVAGWVPSSISEELEGVNELGDYIWDEYLAEEEEAWWGYSQFDFELSTYLDEEAKYYEEFKGTYFLYGFWVPAKLCVQEFSYKQAKLTAENGTVQFKELLKDSDGKVTGSQVHSFAKDGTMLLPYGTKADNNYVVVSVPKDGYVLDSLIMNVGGKKTTYREGDTLSGDIYKATFTAYFVEDNQTPMEFVKLDLQPSGNAVRLELSTTEFRAGGAKLRVTLENNDGKKLVDTLLAKTITKTPYSGEWEYYPLAAGTYLVTATLIRGKETFVLERDFEVKAEIATVEDGWRMISLANVNMDSVAWENDDAKFFWWDETSPFGVIWQYQEFKQGDKVDPLVGYWYSSLSGRSLVTRKDAYTPKSPVAWKLDSLYSGWNLVANPYGWYVNLYGENSASKKDATEKPDVEFLSWNDSLGSYEPVSVVGPNEAVWVQVDGPRTWKLPAKPEYVGLVDEEGETSVVKPLKKTVEVGTFGKNRWAIRAVLSDAKGKRDGWNILGVSETAWNSEEPPAGMGDRVNLSIMEGKKGLAKSFKKASGDSYEWTISLDASGNRMGFLHFEGIRALNAEGLKVFVTVDGETTQMNEGDTLKVALGSMAKTATVRVAPSARVTVAQKLDGLRALHTGNGLQISFNVSESLAGQRTRVELLDTKGKVLSSASGKAVSGSNSMQVDTPKSGLYMVRVRVGSKQAVVNVLVK